MSHRLRRRWIRPRTAILGVVVAAVAGATALLPNLGAEAAETVLDGFDSATVGQTPAGWSVTGSGSATVEQPPAGGVQAKALRLVDTSAVDSLRVARGFAGTGDNVVAGVRIVPAQTDAVIGVHLSGDAGQAVTVGLDTGGRWYTYRGTQKVDLGAYAANRSYDLRVVARPSTGTATVYIDGVQVAAGVPFRHATTGLDRLEVTLSKETRGAVSLDDVRIDIEAPASTAFAYLGAVKQKDARSIPGSSIAVGTETTDRGYTNHDSFAKYLGPLGAKATRMQPGWARVEQVAGTLNFAAPKKEIDYAVAHGVAPWINVSYGNPDVYGAACGGGIGSGAPLPTGTCLERWDTYVRGLCATVKDSVRAAMSPNPGTFYEIWNEPDLNGNVTAADAARFFQRTALILRQCQPEAKILAVSAAGIFGTPNYFEQVITELVTLEKARLGSTGVSHALDLVDAITYHSYGPTPDNRYYYQQVDKVRTRLAEYGKPANGGMRVPPLWMGEHGYPSNKGCCALGDLDTTELIQAKADARRVLADLGKGIPTSVFGLSDMKYPYGVNTKGLVRFNSETRDVTYAKPAYYTVQHLTSVFDNTLAAIPGYGGSEYNTISPAAPLAAYGFRDTGTNRQIAAVWRYGTQDQVPTDAVTRQAATLTFPNGDFADPVYVDTRTGEVYDIPDANWSRSGTTYTFTAIPVGDWPILVADRSLIDLA